MLTYETKITKNRLEIRFDTDPESPRDWRVIGKFITNERNYESPDKDKYLLDVIIQTSNNANSLDEHIELIKKEIEDIVYIYPITRYEHSNIVYELGHFRGWDYSPCAFYIVTQEGIDEFGIKTEDEVIKTIQAELDNYNSWVNGEVYKFYLYDENGEFQDACGGFYDIEDIREHLPEEFHNEDLEDYLIY